MKDFQSKLDGFIGWMEKDGMIDRWKRQKETAGVQRNLRRLNRKIRETETINETLQELGVM